ncbi:MAG: VCBS repeat-containing protein [Bacteroidota bacterium]|nr:VCBS repeat-containing protein [Bacteroidota bacterium]
MTASKKMILLPAALGLMLWMAGCRHKDGGAEGSDDRQPVFNVLEHSSTGLDFSNTLHPNGGFNVFDYMYFYNGGGVGAGDFNHDGRIDLFFASSQEDNKLYLNMGDLHFKDVTGAARIPQDKGWSTGVSVVDINNDGLLDIYVCKVGNLNGLPITRNQLLVCQGIGKDGVPTFKDEAAAYGLDFCGFSTQAVFFDYDGDGDLDMYLLNHSIHQNGTFGPRQQKLATYNPLSGDRLFRNDGGHFTDVTKDAGIHSSVIGYGLGIVVSDIDLDGYPDIYVGNDFHENDYLYINDRHGHFRDELTERVMHTSQFSMGVDIGDVNNDGYPEIISMDMLAYDPYILKRSLGEDDWNTFYNKIGMGYNYQYTRNNLQLNCRNGCFSEVGLYAGVAATDWSWSPLWVDFDNDGLKDLFISNGIPKRMNDIDFINFISNQELQQKMRDKALDNSDMALINKFPEIKLPSKFFRNTGELKFEDLKDQVSGSRPTYSNGAIYADLDNDGDLDIVVNNIDEPVLLYQNTENDKAARPYVDITLRGPEKNINALGAKLILFANQGIRTYEKYPVRGFLSSMEIPLHVGLDKTVVDSAFLVWPDNTYQPVTIKPGHPQLQLAWQKGLPHFDYSRITSYWKNPTRPVRDITAATGLLHRHKENDFHEFDREPLLPHMLSTEGPALAVGDINKDGLEDVFIGSSKWEKSAIFLQDKAGKFRRSAQPALEGDSLYEDVDACFADMNHDGNEDLIVASGGNEYYGQDTALTPRIYLGDGSGHFSKMPNPFGELYVNASCVAPCDINGDGYTDLFIGGRDISWDYGKTPQSYLFLNDGKGKFVDVTGKLAAGLDHVGFVTSAQWIDLDKNGEKDLLLTLEWGGIVAFMNHHGVFTRKLLCDKKGWWNFVLAVDIDHDGDIDLIAGNLGLNSRLKASEKEPVRLYYSDFDNNGKKEQVLTYYLDGRELPFANKEELEHQMPILKKQFLYAEDFAKASLHDLFPDEQLAKADTLTADYFSNALLINDGHLNFRVQALPWQAQLAPYRDAVVIDANGDALPDILLVGNYYDNNIQMGRYDADYGTVLINKGHDSLVASTLNGVVIKGQTRHIRRLDIAGQPTPSYVLVRNNDSTMVIRFAGAGAGAKE